MSNEETLKCTSVHYLLGLLIFSLNFLFYGVKIYMERRFRFSLSVLFSFSSLAKMKNYTEHGVRKA
jgi:hypothetical protein